MRLKYRNDVGETESGPFIEKLCGKGKGSNMTLCWHRRLKEEDCAIAHNLCRLQPTQGRWGRYRAYTDRSMPVLRDQVDPRLTLLSVVKGCAHLVEDAKSRFWGRMGKTSTLSGLSRRICLSIAYLCDSMELIVVSTRERLVVQCREFPWTSTLA
jgi:hypothetical protein